MKRTVLAVSCIALFVASSASAWAQTAPKDIQAFYNKVGAAEEKKDLAAMSGLVTPDFTLTDVGGAAHNLTQVKQVWKNQMATMQNIRSKYAVLKVTVAGKTAVATVLATMSSDYTAPRAAKAQKLKATGKSTDTLVRTPEGWKMKKIVQKSLQVTLDGKPMPGT